MELDDLKYKNRDTAKQEVLTPTLVENILQLKSTFIMDVIHDYIKDYAFNLICMLCLLAGELFMTKHPVWMWLFAFSTLLLVLRIFIHIIFKRKINEYLETDVPLAQRLKYTQDLILKFLHYRKLMLWASILFILITFILLDIYNIPIFLYFPISIKLAILVIVLFLIYNHSRKIQNKMYYDLNDFLNINIQENEETNELPEQKG